MVQSTAQKAASILVAKDEYTGSLEWSELVSWVNKSAAERLILEATERVTGDVFRGQLAEVYDKGLNLVFQVPEQFTKFGQSAGYAEYVALRSPDALLPMRRDDGSVEIKTGHKGEFDLRIYPHGAVPCLPPNHRR